MSEREGSGIYFQAFFSRDVLCPFIDCEAKFFFSMCWYYRVYKYFGAFHRRTYGVCVYTVSLSSCNNKQRFLDLCSEKKKILSLFGSVIEKVEHRWWALKKTCLVELCHYIEWITPS